MGEADWWLCASCSSLNNLAARKCYSCEKRKPKAAVRASEYLGYRPVVSWDGKVKMEPLTAEELGAPAAGAEAQRPPLREPVPRDTLAVAPRPPHPARITYRLEEPLPPPGRPSHKPAHGREGSAPPPAGAAGPGGVPARPMTAVGPGPSAAARPPDEPWPHWRELLDGPTPHADRMRDAGSGQAETKSRAGSGPPQGGMTLRSAIRSARTGDAREFIPWPEADRLPDPEATEEATPTPSPADRSPE